MTPGWSIRSHAWARANMHLTSGASPRCSDLPKSFRKRGLRDLPNRLKLMPTMNGHELFLRIPPFPGAKVQSLARPRSIAAESLADEAIDSLIEHVRSIGVFGRYWKPQAENDVRDIA